MSEILLGDRNAQDSFTALVRDSSLSGVERRVLVVRTDALPPTLSRPAHQRRVREAIDPLLLADRGRCQELPGRLVVSWRGEAPRLLQEAVERLDALLKDDPFQAPGINQLTAFYNLPRDALALVRDVAAGAAAPAAEVQPPPEPVFDAPVALRPIETSALERIERGLALADLSRFTRRHPVCYLSSHGMQLAWEDRFLSVAELIADVAPGFDAKSDPWLFRRLTRILDRRMLSMLGDSPELRDSAAFGLTLNVASVLSSEFLRFDSVLPSGLRNRIVINFLPADLAADAGAFAFARNFARARLYRTGLRAITASLLPALDIPALDLDFAQLVWSPALTRLPQLPATGRARWIMGRPCTKEAIEWGTKAGIGLYATPATQ